MTFDSILFPHPHEQQTDSPAEPACFPDLNLDQAVAGIAGRWPDYDLTPFFHRPLSRLDGIQYRQAVFQDLDRSEVMAVIRGFAQAMKRVRQCRGHAANLYYEEQRQRWLLAGVLAYAGAVIDLREGLNGLELASEGLRSFSEYVRNYVDTDAFQAMDREAEEVRKQLESLRYSIRFTQGGFEVYRYDDEPDLGAEVLEVFQKFQQRAVKDWSAEFRDPVEMNHIEAIVLRNVARLFPLPFNHLADFAKRYARFRDDRLVQFDREIHFYRAYLESLRPLKDLGMPFCYPNLHDEKTESCQAAFDLALALSLAAEHKTVVTNDFSLSGDERLIIVSGPNNGGKTTFARLFGQLHYLARLGVPVPGEHALLYLSGPVLTHFEREEHSANLHGKLEDDLLRANDLLGRLTPDTVVILNEIFHSTTLSDARFLTRKVLEAVSERDCIGMCVTFVDEMASLNAKTVSMVSTVNPEDLTQRTFKLVRRPADGLAYALSLAEKYDLTQTRLLERLPE